jgi:chitosanase
MILALSVPTVSGINFLAKASADPVCIELPITNASASGHSQANVPQNVIDGKLGTRWSAQGRGSWISLDLGRIADICHVDVAWYRGNVRQSTFTLSSSVDGKTFTTLIQSGQSLRTINLQRYDIAEGKARFVKVTVDSSTENNWASITEIKVFGDSNNNSNSNFNSIQDTAKPFVSIDNPAQNSEIFTTSPSSTTTSVSITGKASELGGSIRLVEVRTENTPFRPANPTSSSSSGSWATWTSSVTLSIGNHQITARATDSSGNQQIFSISVKVSQKEINSNVESVSSMQTKPTSGSTSKIPAGVDLFDPHKKDIAMQLVSSAENSSLDWRAQYKYIEDIGDGRGYTAGIMGFCSGTGDMLEVVQYYTQLKPNNILAKYIPALERVEGTSSHKGLDPNYVNDWKNAASDPLFQQAQDHERDMVYFNPAVQQAKADGLQALGQFIYFDAIVMHGPGSDPESFGGIRAASMHNAKTPKQGGDEIAYLNAFLDARIAVMHKEAAHDDTSRIDTEQRVFLQQGNLALNTPLRWNTYGDPYTILQ